MSAAESVAAAMERQLGDEEGQEVFERRGFFATAGDIVAFGANGVRNARHLREMTAEVLRQATLIATGSVLVICAIAFLAGGSCGLESTALARSFGVDPIAGGFSTWCTLREVVPFVFGYILAAKVGCGMVAQLGAMRVQEEIDALEAMGVRPMAYLVATRMAASTLVLPFAYALSVLSAYLAAYLMSVVRFGDVSKGTWELFFYAFQDPLDLVYSGVKALLIAVFVISTSLYFGYTVRGGPAEVGQATARAMGVNIVGVTLISVFGTLVFWGANPRIPVG